MKVQALPNETVNGILYRVLKTDSDEVEEAFYRLNPNQKTPFLTSLQVVEIPDTIEKAEPAATEEIEVWE